LREEYNRSDSPLKAGFPPQAYALIAPKACALGVERGLVNDDGTMSERTGHDLMVAAVERMGVARFQTLVFNELAVNQYHLAERGRVTRWDRCVAMGYSGYDAQRAQDRLPRRGLFFRAVREACTVGVERGIVPQGGAPATASLRRLLAAALLKLSR
jgi:hypothetical protein